jgi:anti-sigma factor RsiW
MPCESWREKLDAYADGELPVAEANALAAHLPQCADCASQVLRRVQMKRSVAMAGKRYEPSAEFRQKMMATMSKPSRRSGAWIWRIIALPAALVLIVSLGVNFYVSREKSRRERVFSELADLHISALASSQPVDVISTDRHTVKPWFEGKIPFSFNLPELQGTDFALVGGRVAYLGQTPGAHLVYRIRKHELSVFIFPDRAGETSGLTSSPISVVSFTEESWTKSGLQYFVIGDVGAGDIESLSKLLRDAS